MPSKRTIFMVQRWSTQAEDWRDIFPVNNLQQARHEVKLRLGWGYAKHCLRIVRQTTTFKVVR